jgi:hypothetical protein
MAALKISKYFDQELSYDDQDVNQMLNLLCFISEDQEVIFDFRLYKKLYPHFEKVVEHSVQVFQELERRREADSSILNIIHINLVKVHLKTLEKYHQSIREFMTRLMNIFPTYELNTCYTHNASIIFVAIKKLAQAVYYGQDIKNKIIIFSP